MYQTAKQQSSSSRWVGLATAIGVNGLVGLALASGLGTVVVDKITKTEVAIVEAPPIEEEEPPPPPPVDVELPPPPPQVVLPEFTFDVPVQNNNAIQNVTPVERPVQPPPRAVPPAPPKPVVSAKPSTGRRFQRPPYPPASQRAKEEGTVTMRLCLDAEGRVTKADLAKSSGFPRLDEATTKWIARERFNPAKDQNGKGIEFCPWDLDIEWKLE